jgi:hypothetical protein
VQPGGAERALGEADGDGRRGGRGAQEHGAQPLGQARGAKRALSEKRWRPWEGCLKAAGRGRARATTPRLNSPSRSGARR